jgi:long-chain acyl-CoA synthetase
MGSSQRATAPERTTVPLPPEWLEAPARAAQVWTSATDHLLAAGREQDPAVLEAGGETSFGALRSTVAALAGALRDHGVPPGSRVGVLGPSSTFWVAGYLAGMQEHVAVPFSDKVDAAEVAARIERVDCRAVFLDRRLARRYADAIPEHVVVVTDAVLDDDAGPELARREIAQAEVPRPADPDADAVLLFTSGTTAAAKVVRLTHRNVVANTESIVQYLGLTREDRMLVVLPFFYCFGLSLLHTHLRVGGSVSLCNSFVFPEVALDQLERDRCTGFAGVPSSYQLLLRASSFQTRELPHLRTLQQAGGKLSPALVEDLVRTRPATRLFVMYGQTEATARLSYLPPELALTKAGSVGRGIPGVELRVLAADGRQVAPGEVGEIYAHGDNVSPGYLDDPEESASKFPSGALRTGDLATVDEEGYVFVVDRVDDFIKSWGHRIASQEVEDCVMRIPDLVSAAAVGLPDPESGEAVVVAVTRRPGSEVTADDVLTFARAELPRHVAPRWVTLLDELPLNANGKTDKRQLRDLLGAQAQSSRTTTSQE